MSESTPPTPNTKDKNTISVNIEDEMRGAYLDYAMSVIIGRALPDVRDGLKPVHRRVLYAMYDLNNTYQKPYKKSARVVGDVIGKYHPHGDSAVYDTMVRMAQDFSLRYPLIDGQGNFGSIDGDAPAAMRYTEVRMARVTDELLDDLDKETVDLGPNYDETLKEPTVLPAKFPNLLVNGSAGIAVGMATNIPPHNLTEVVDATLALIDKPELKTVDLLEYVKGPDFPTAGAILGTQGIKQAYLTGHGIISIRAKTEIEQSSSDRERIVVYELPYQVNKAKLIEKIAELVKEKRLEGISDLRDESDRKGMRIVVDVKRGENANVLLNQLYKLTPMQESYGISLLAIHQNQPKIFNLRDMIWAFIEHRKDVVLRRTAHELRKAEARAHLLEGLKKAVDHIDAVIALIKAAPGPQDAQVQLMQKYQLSDVQAQAILEMRLQRLTGLEREKIVQDYKAVLALIEELKSILASEALVFKIIREELQEIRQKYGDKRRTEIVIDDSAGDLNIEDLISDDETLVTITHTGYIKRSDLDQFRRQNRGGKGVKGVTTTETDFVSAIYKTTNLSDLLCFTDRGRMYRVKVYQIPEASRSAKGRAIVNLLSLQPGENVRAILPVREFKESEFVVFVTSKGVIKKTPLSDFKNVRTAGIIAITVEDGDTLVSANLTDGQKEVFLCSKEGKCIRFGEDEVRAMGRTARGVHGMSLEDGDVVVATEVLDPQMPDGEILTVTDAGHGKRTPISDYRKQSRAGKGVLSMNLSERNGHVMACAQVMPNDEVMLVSSKGKMIRISVAGISEQGRVTQGVKLISLEPSERVVAMELIADQQDDSKH